MAIYNTYFSVLGLQDSLGVLPNLGVLPGLGRLDDLGEYAFSPASLFLNGEQGVWYDPSDLTPEKVSWRRNLLTYSQDFENAAWTKSNASILSNLALYSQDFDNAYWTKFRGTLTANNATAPDGTTTADTWTEDTASGTHEINASVLTLAANVTMTYQVRVKRSSGSRNFRITSYAGVDGLRAVFNLDTLVATNASYGTSTFVSASVVSIGSGWFLCTLTGSIATANPIVAFELVSGTSTVIYTGDGTSGLQFWGAQFVPGSTAQTYTRSLATAAPIQFSDPLGGTLADVFIPNTTSTDHHVQNSATGLTAAYVYTVSVYAKVAGYSVLQIFWNGVHVTGAPRANFDLANGTLGTVDSNVTATIVNVGSGWYRCTASVAVAGNALTTFFAAIPSSTSARNPTFAGDGVSGLYVYGAQVEQASTASAYQRITDFTSDFLAAFPTHALYQDSTFATPVTALGQSVGGVIDKRLGGLASIGLNVLSNGDFSNGTTGWTLGVNTTTTVEPSFAGRTNALRIVNTSTTSITTSATVTGLTTGRSYLVTYDVYSPSTNTQVNAGACYTTETSAARSAATAEDVWQTRQFLFTAASTSTQVFINAATAGTSATSGDQALFDNISVREVSGNHAIQATSASRPTLQARANLMTYSEQFDNAAWTKTAATITPNATVAPDGTTTADKQVEDSTTAAHLSFISGSGITVASGVSYTYSVYVKAAERTFCQVRYENATSTKLWAANVNLSDGTFATTSFGSPTGTAASVTPVGSGWYRVALTVTTDTTGFKPIHYTQAVQGTNSYTGDGTSGIFIWGAQLEQASTASTYQRIVTATDYADVGLPRNLTFDGVDDSLATAGNVDFATWTVGTRRNLLVNPTQFDAATWTNLNATVSPNTDVAPDGTTTADKLVSDTLLGQHRTGQAPTSPAGTQTFSVYCKAAGYGFAWLRIDALNAVYNLSNGAISGLAGGATASATDVGNGWWRLAISGTTIANGIVRINMLPTASTADFTGDGTSGILLWGAQLETGSTATAFQNVGTDKVSVFSGVTKLSDAALAMAVELSATLGSNNGTFGLTAPLNTTGSTYGFASKGTAFSAWSVSGASFAAPNTSVATGLGDIGGDIQTLRLNGVNIQTLTNDQGTGTYGSYLLYVGRRGGSSLPFNGRLFQLVIRGAATDSVTVGNAERWVGQLTGVAL